MVTGLIKDKAIGASRCHGALAPLLYKEIRAHPGNPGLKHGSQNLLTAEKLRKLLKLRTSVNCALPAALP